MGEILIQTNRSIPKLFSFWTISCFLLLQACEAGAPEVPQPTSSLTQLAVTDAPTPTRPPADVAVPDSPEPPGELLMVAVLDDHYDIPTDRYRLTVKLDGQLVFAGPVELEHGEPSGGVFVNFGELLMPLDLSRLDEEGNELEISLSGVDPYHWLAWDYLVVSSHDKMNRIDSKGDWGYSTTGVDVIYGGQSQTVAFDLLPAPDHTPEPIISAIPPQTPLPENTPTLTPDCTGGWSRLSVGIYSVVVGAPGDPPNRVRSAPDTTAEIIALLYTDHLVLVLEGPVCADGLVFWKVSSDAIPEGEGWTAEGNGEVFWLQPVIP